ncbi:unnamed protein product [Musa acuminata var. zebrina]
MISKNSRTWCFSASHLTCIRRRKQSDHYHCPQRLMGFSFSILFFKILVSYNCMISFLHLSNLYSCKLYKFLNQIKKKNSFIRVSDIRLKVIFFIAQNNLSSSVQCYACLYLQ